MVKLFSKNYIINAVVKLSKLKKIKFPKIIFNCGTKILYFKVLSALFFLNASTYMYVLILVAGPKWSGFKLQENITCLLLLVI